MELTAYTTQSETTNLGKNWHFRVGNKAGDFSYAMLQIICFHLSKADLSLSTEWRRKMMAHYNLHQRTLNNLTYIVVFKFVHGDGNKNLLTFYNSE